MHLCQGDILPTFVDPEWGVDAKERKKLESSGILDKLKVCANIAAPSAVAK